MIAVVIPTLDPQLTYPKDLDHVFVVYDGAPTPLCSPHFLRAPQKGFAYACNVGIAHAQSLGYTWVLILNDDATITHLHMMCSKIAPRVGAIGTVIEDDHGIQSAGILVSFWGRVKMNRDISQKDVPALSGACMLVCSWARFDAGYRHGFEDIDLCVRLKRKGYSIVLDKDSRCFHKGGASIAHHTKMWFAHSIYGQLRFYNKRRLLPIVMLLGCMQTNMNKACMRGVWEGGKTWWRQRMSSAT